MNIDDSSPENHQGLITELFTWVDHNTQKRHKTIRVTWLYPPKPIDPSLGVYPIPGAAILLYNVIKAERVSWSTRVLTPPQPLDGIEFRARVDCIAESDSAGVRINLCSYLTAAHNLPPEELIDAAKRSEKEFHRGRVKIIPKTEKRERGVIEAIGGRMVDHVKNVEEVGNRLLTEHYPRVYSVLKDNKLRESPLRQDHLKSKVAEALFLDLLNQGVNNIGLKNLNEVISNNPSFMAKMQDAYEKKCPVSEIALHLFRGWITDEYLRLSGDELSEKIHQKIGHTVKPNTLTKLISRMGLERATTIGAPPKKR